jgi:DUF917 family protein
MPRQYEDARGVSLDEIESLALGAWVLGAGGGGNPYHALLNLRRLYRDGSREIRLLNPESLGDDDRVAVVSAMGAPLVGEERLEDPETAAKPVRMLEEHLGSPFDAVMSLEIGGANSLQPFLVAAELGLPVVDADCMGRAFPEAQMTSFAIADLKCYPLALADIRDNAVIVSRASSWKWMERISRKVCTEVGSIAATCKAPRTGKEVKEWGILHSTTRAIRIGEVIREARGRSDDPVMALVGHEEGMLLFRGKVSDVSRETTEGFLRGYASVAGMDDDRGKELRLEFQNEFAVGFLDRRAIVTVPEIICVMDSVSGEAIGTETLRYGQRVSVVALPADPILMTEKGLLHVGPRAFGYDLDFQSLFTKD